MTVDQVPLHVLTINGGGYQGIASLLILDALIKNVTGISQDKPGRNQRPIKPCDMFDVIGGVGSGGWLALLLGRCRLTISECLHEYFNIVGAMTRRQTPSGPSSTPLHRNVYDIDALIHYVECLTDEYGTGKMLLDNDCQTSRCQHTFVVTCCKENEEPKSGFCVFRTYKTEETTRLDPANIRISHAFAAAGAKKGFLYPFKLTSAKGSTLKFGTEIIPEYFTNATTYALKEIRQQFGEHQVIPAILNIGPGNPNIETVKTWEKMREIFPWHLHKKNPLLITVKDSPPAKDNPNTKDDRTTTNTTYRKRSGLAGKFLGHFYKEEKCLKRSWSILERIESSQADIELQIKEELKKFDSRAKYIRLMPDKGPNLKACSDLTTSQETKKCAEDYLSSEEAVSSMKQYGEVIPLER